MKKSPLIAAAIAAVISGSTFADSTVYGNIRLQLKSEAELSLDSTKLVFGFKGSDDLGNGMTGFYHIEMENDDADHESLGTNGGLTNDKSYVGIKGDFGQLTLGAQGDAAGFACGGTDIFVYNSGNVCGIAAANGTLNNAISYVNGTDNVTFVAGLTFDGDITTGVESDGAGNPAPGNHSLLAVKYAADAFSVGAQYTAPDSDLGLSDDWLVVGGTYTINDIMIGLTVANNGETATSLAVQMPVAGGKLKVGYDTGEDAGVADTVNLEFDKSLSKAVYVGAQYSDVDGADDSIIAGYMGYKF